MAKRMTETGKWRDGWFAELSPDHKLAWLYLLDVCDNAGVVEINRRIDSACLGFEVDWPAFLAASAGRVVEFSAGKLLVVNFVRCQYGDTLNPESTVHRGVLRSLAKHGIDPEKVTLTKPFANPLERVTKPFGKGYQTLKDKDKDKDKDKVLEEGGVGETEIPAPSPIELIADPATREAVEGWVAYKAERRERPKPRSLAALCTQAQNAASEHGAAEVARAMAEAQANGWKGWTHTLGKPASDGGRGSPQRFLPAMTKGELATQRFLARHADDGDTAASGVLGQPAVRGEGPPAGRLRA
jgi:hypothetical protein